eukprot:PITA_13833
MATKGHIELKLGVRGFFMVIFLNLQDKEKVFENGPYFHYNVGLFMRYWEECYDPDKENFLATPVWVRLFSLPMDFLDLEILEGIGNMIGRFVKIIEMTKKGRYTSYTRICVYMNIVEPIPDLVELEYYEEVWKQTLDYEHMSFRCHRCHKYGHLFKEFPLNLEEGENIHMQQRKPQEDKEKKKRKIQEKGKEISSSQGKLNPKRKAQREPVDKEDKEDRERIENTTMEIDPSKGEELSMEEEMLKKLLNEWRHLGERFILENQKRLYRETFQQYQAKQEQG